MIYISLIILCLIVFYLLYVVEQLNKEMIFIQESIKEKEGEKNV